MNPCTTPSECSFNSEFPQNTVESLRRNFFISQELYDDYVSKCRLRTPACDDVEQLIESNFRITGADTHNLYKECLHQPGDYPCIDHTGVDIFLNVENVREDLNVDRQKKWEFCSANLS